MGEMEASMDRVDRNVCNAHAFVLITNQQHFQSGEHPGWSIPELSPWSVNWITLRKSLGDLGTCEATSWEGTGDGAGEDRVPGFPTDGSSVADLSYGIFSSWKGGEQREQSQNWCIMEIYEFYLTFTFVYCIHFLQNHCLSLWFQFDMTKWELISWFHYFWLCSWLKDHSVNLWTVQITELSTVCR